MKIAVFLGSVNGNQPLYAANAEKVGALIGDTGNDLIYGGACVGTMNNLAEAAMNHGARVIGVMPEFMIETGRNREDLNEMIVVESMSERKKKMLEEADLSIALPGGPGTLEEIVDAVSWKRLNRIHGRVCFLNTNGYFDPLKQMYQAMIEAGFYTEEEFAEIRFFDNIDALKEFVH